MLVTHGISFLPQTDFIIVLADGQVSEVGPYSALLQRDGSFASFLRNYAPDDEQEELGSKTGTRCSQPSPTPAWAHWASLYRLRVITGRFK